MIYEQNICVYTLCNLLSIASTVPGHVYNIALALLWLCFACMVAQDCFLPLGIFLSDAAEWYGMVKGKEGCCGRHHNVCATHAYTSTYN